MNADEFLTRVGTLNAVPTDLPKDAILDIKKLREDKVAVYVGILRDGIEYWSLPQVRPKNINTDERVVNIMKRAVAMGLFELSIKLKDESIRPNLEDFEIDI